MIRRPPRSTRTDTRFPYTTLFRSVSVVAGELVDPGGKDLAPRRAELEAGFAQRRPHHVLERAHLVQNRTPRHQERSPLPALSALNVNLLVPARAHDLRQRPGVVAVGQIGRAHV